MSIYGLPQPADLAGAASYIDPLASTFKLAYKALGRNGSGESGTAAMQAYTAYGQDAALLPSLSLAQQGLATWAMKHAFDRFYSYLAKLVLLPLDTQTQNKVPSAWKYVNNTATFHALDAHLLRLNACHPGVPLAIGGALTLTAINSSGGALPNFTSGNCPYILVTAVGANDYDESLVSATATQIALTGSQNAFQLAISGTVPTPAPKKLRIYRTKVGVANTGPYCFDQDVLVTTTAGSAWPAVVATLVQGDSSLQTDQAPPAWLSCPQVPEAAFLWAAANATAPPPNPQTLYIPGPIQLFAAGMFSPWNVVLNPCNGWLGLGNTPAINSGNLNTLAGQASSAMLGIQVLGTGFTAGSILQANSAAIGLQGFAGAYGGGGTTTFLIQARAIGMLNGARVPTISYTYYDSTHPGSNLQTATGLGPTGGVGFAGSVLGEIITYTIPAGRLVVSVSAESATGGATTGTYIYEAQPVRTI